MDSLLHTLCLRTRLIAGVLASVFLLSSLLVMTPVSAKGMDPDHGHAMPMPGMMHHCGHSIPATPASRHHGNHACCLGAMNCAQACNHSLMAFGGIDDLSGATAFPSAPDSSGTVTRFIEPPRRPPKA